MKKLKKDLQAVSKELKALANKTEGIMKAVAKLEKTQVKTKAKAKPGRKAPAKKPAAKKATAPKATAQTATAQTATDQVVNIIKTSEEGVGVPTLVKKTGLADKQIRNIVFKAFKEAKIKRAGRGIYVAA